MLLNQRTTIPSPNLEDQLVPVSLVSAPQAHHLEWAYKVMNVLRLLVLILECFILWSQVCSVIVNLGCIMLVWIFETVLSFWCSAHNQGSCRSLKNGQVMKFEITITWWRKAITFSFGAESHRTFTKFWGRQILFVRQSELSVTSESILDSYIFINIIHIHVTVWIN